jgi:hypothetical protein
LIRKERYDSLSIYSVLLSKIQKEIPIKLDEVESIDFADNERLVISGFKDGRCGLYLLDSVSGELSSLTNACDKFPSCYKDKCLFVRQENGSSSIWILDMRTGESKPLFSLADVHKWPTWIDEDRFLFISNEDGGFNLYLCDIEKKSYAKITDFVGGVQSGAVSPSKDRIAFTQYYQGKVQLYIMDLKEELQESALPEFTSISKEETLPKLTKKAYSTNLSFDWRKGDFLYDSREGLIGRMNIAASDVLGNHRLILSADYASELSNLSNLAFSYHYLEKRPSMGVGIFSEKRRYFGTGTEEFIDTKSGIEGYIDYPLSRFRRIELAGLIERWETDYTLPQQVCKKKLDFDKYFYRD